MRDYLANNRGDRYGKFVYSIDLIDDDIEALHEEFAPVSRALRPRDRKAK